MTLSDKRNVWDKLDAAFKVVKEKKICQKKENHRSKQRKDRLNNHYNGLLPYLNGTVNRF